MDDSLGMGLEDEMTLELCTEVVCSLLLIDSPVEKELSVNGEPSSRGAARWAVALLESGVTASTAEALSMVPV